VPFLAAGSQVFGASLLLLRAIPAAFAAGGAYVTCLFAIELGGGAFAQLVAALAFFFANVLMSFGMKVGPDMVGLWLWPLAALYVLRIVKGADARLWLAAGAALGVSLESKYSVIFFAVALLAGLLLTRQRRVLASPWFLGGLALAAAIALPNFLWQALHGFPMWELLRNGQSGKNLAASPGLYLLQQLLLTNLFLSPIWIAGWFWLLRDTTTRFVAYAFAILTISMIVLHAKHYYAANAYPMLIAAGGVAFERWTARAPWIRPALIAAALVAGLFFLPFTLPVLREEQMLRYTTFVGTVLHINRATMQTERGRMSALPEDWADMHGWPLLAQTVTRIYEGLPAAQRRQAAIFASNYGEAAAIDFFGDHLPPALSGHNNYWLWGPRGYSGDVVIRVNGDCGAKDHLFRSARLLTRLDAPWVISYERDIPIMLCTGIRVPLTALWPKLRNYI
jgi:4-amino-4-deoxy-L-arabinose transferase-like glycosyltransferase